MTPRVAGRHLGASVSKITRMERGQVAVKDADLSSLLTLYGVTDGEERLALLQLNNRLNEAKWWTGPDTSLAGWFCSYLVLESIADYIWTYENRFIPGLLQTAAYAEAVIRTRCNDTGMVRRLVEVRMNRQRMILRDKATRLWAVIDQTALDDGPGDPGLMREQMQFLLRATEETNVRIQVVKPGAGAYAARSNSFSILRLPGKRLSEVVYLEHLDRALFLDSPQDSDPYRIAMNEIGVAADEPAATRASIEKAMQRFRKRST
jgi:uncharacterized small protein (DUF1192 family)